MCVLAIEISESMEEVKKHKQKQINAISDYPTHSFECEFLGEIFQKTPKHLFLVTLVLT